MEKNYKVVINYTKDLKKEERFDNIKDTLDMVEKYYKYAPIEFYDYSLSDNMIMVIDNDITWSELCDMYFGV